MAKKLMEILATAKKYAEKSAAAGRDAGTVTAAAARLEQAVEARKAAKIAARQKRAETDQALLELKAVIKAAKAAAKVKTVQAKSAPASEPAAVPAAPEKPAAEKPKKSK